MRLKHRRGSSVIAEILMWKPSTLHTHAAIKPFIECILSVCVCVWQGGRQIISPLEPSHQLQLLPKGSQRPQSVSTAIAQSTRSHYAMALLLLCHCQTTFQPTMSGKKNILRSGRLSLWVGWLFWGCQINQNSLQMDMWVDCRFCFLQEKKKDKVWD